jgi:hypothetical protein
MLRVSEYRVVRGIFESKGVEINRWLEEPV